MGGRKQRPTPRSKLAGREETWDSSWVGRGVGFEGLGGS